MIWISKKTRHVFLTRIKISIMYRTWNVNEMENKLCSWNPCMVCKVHTAGDSVTYFPWWTMHGNTIKNIFIKNGDSFITFCLHTYKVILEKSRGEIFLWNRNWDLGWTMASLATFEAGFFMFSWARFFQKHCWQWKHFKHRLKSKRFFF